ncbi:MAG TPA: thermonuclease family protein [Gaiellaceae bacterium]|nr:thermonuclease family protein [Gaiellaceae bacterium]
MRRLRILLACGAVAARAGVAAADAGRFSLGGTVTRVVDGDTVDVTLASGKRERVRLIGIDTPETGTCHAARATAAVRRLAQGARVSLRGDPTQDTRDRYGRLLAYVWLPGGRDLGYQLLAGGHARVYVYGGRPFQRVAPYRSAEAAGRKVRPSVWTCAAAPAPAPPPSGGGRCDPSYPDVCIPPPPPDLDCKDVPHKGFRVVGADPHRFDGDRDGVGCER